MQPEKNREYTYRDYAAWPEEEHWELIDGRAYPTYGPTALAAPSLTHQAVAGELFYLFKSYLRNKQCVAFISPTDVVFEESESTKTVVQPDVLVVCDPKKIENGKRIIGAPDIVVEVLSPSTTAKDWIKKTHLYETHGVKEYWIVSPDARTVHKSSLKNGQYETTVFEDGQMPSEVLEDFSLDIKEFFDAL